jgi:glycosyltransferase involved in cell wall biosynthesis
LSHSLKVSGFTICRNSVSLGYPFLESIRSLAPLCDEIVVAVGDSEDNTTEHLEALKIELQNSPKPCDLRLVDSPWDTASLKGGLELSRQTNIALEECQNEIVFYLQSDEVLHEEDYSIIRDDLKKLAQHPQAAGLLFQWVHFFGSKQTEVYSRKWYRREVRAFKKSSGLKSYKDAQGFRQKLENGKWVALPMLLSQARVLHYGWVRPPEMMVKKANDFHKWWHGGQGSFNAKTLFKPQHGIRYYRRTHPEVMSEYLSKIPDPESQVLETLFKAPLNKAYVKAWLTDVIEKMSGCRPGEFKNYSKIVP